MPKRVAFAAAVILSSCLTARQQLSPGTSIRAIQGRGHRSPLEGKSVAGVEGIVTAILAGGRAPGFWMEAAGGGPSDVSSAIFVSTRNVTAPPLLAGDAVRVSGRVEEEGFAGGLTTTEIVHPDIAVASHGNALPKAVRIGAGGRRIPDAVIDDDSMRSYDPGQDAIDFWESLEGMRIEVPDAIVAGPTTEHGDITVLANHGASSTVRSRRGGVVIRNGDYNPERIIIDPRLVAPPPSLNTGDVFTAPITGVVDYGFGNYRLLNTAPLPPANRAAVARDSTALRGTRDELTIATYNVLNLAATSTDSRFARLAQSIAADLASPDVIGLEEIQDDSGAEDDGVVTASKTLERLVSAVEHAGGPRYSWAEIDPLNDQDGGQPGGNIRVVLLFNPARVTLVARGRGTAVDPTALEGSGAATSLTLNPGRVDPQNPCFAGGGSGALAEPTRKSLAAELRFGDRKLFVVVNHLKSKRGDDPLFGPVQPPRLLTEPQRICQAEIVGRFAASILSRDPEAAVILLGDMNEHDFRPPIRRLIDVSGMSDLIEQIALPDRYTFLFEGNSQVLDHILVSPALRAGAEVDIVHVNADFADSVAASDHDPILARVRP